MLRTLVAVAVALLPGALKIAIYRRVYGYRIGRDVRIGLSIITGVPSLTIGDHCRVGHFNRFKDVPAVAVGSYCTIGHLNEFVSSREFTCPASLRERQNRPQLVVGDHVGISSRHYFDIEDRVTVGPYTAIAGLRSAFITHGVDVLTSRQTARPITIGAYSMVGSNVLFHPGSGVADRTVVGMGSVVTRRFIGPGGLIGGNPAKLYGRLPDTAKYFRRRLGWIGSYSAPPFPQADGSAEDGRPETQ